MMNLNHQPLSSETIPLEIHKFLQKYVPKIIATEDLFTVGSYKNNELIKQLLEQIAWWLFEGEQEKELLKLEKLNNPSNLCGHFFKPGEATYSCRECATDPTCVLCQKCFSQSEHVHHKYRFHSSGGGGCCDCGDIEAWKEYPCCKIHGIDTNISFIDAIDNLPNALKHHAEKIMTILLDYIVDFLTVKRTNTTDLPNDLAVNDPTDTFITMLYNDEVHTFDNVISVLHRATSCTLNEAADMATIIDREGRTAVKIGPSKDCLEVEKTIIHSTLPLFPFSSRRPPPLITNVTHVSIIAHQEFSLDLVNWLKQLAKRSDGLRHLLSNILLRKMKTINQSRTYTGALMLADQKLWKLARLTYQQFFMSTLLMQTHTKKELAFEFTRNYLNLLADFIADDHEHGESISSLSVQLFTVPTLARCLIAEESALSNVFQVIINHCCKLTAENHYKVEMKKLKKHAFRLQYCFFDLKYLLTTISTDWDEKLKEAFKSFFDLFVLFLASIERMDAVTRYTNRHIEHEPSWESSVTLEIRMANIIGLVLKWCSSTTDILFHCLNVVVKKLTELHVKEGAPRIMVKDNNVSYSCIDYDITLKPVSVHYGLTRFAAGLLTECGLLNIPINTPFLQPIIMDIAERSFRALSLCAQVFAGAWRRNGMGLSNQALYSRHYHCRTESFDRDIQLLQACAAILDPNHFCIVLQRKMNLDKKDFKEYLTFLNEEYLSIIIYVCVERYCDGIGQVDYETKACREIIHALAAGPKPHSKIIKVMPNEITRHTAWESSLHKVAELKASRNPKDVARYELKSEYLCEVSPCFYHYMTASDQSNAMTETIRRKKANKLSTVAIPRPSPPFTTPFEKAIKVLLCPVLLEYVKVLLTKYVPKATAPYEWSDRLFEKILYLIGFGIIEERERVTSNKDDPFKFCEKAEESGILRILRGYSDDNSLPLHTENICWVLNAVNDVNNTRIGINEAAKAEQPIACSSHEDNPVTNLKKEMAVKRRKNLIEHMKMMQRKFLEKMSPEVSMTESLSLPPTAVSAESVSASSVCTELSWQLSCIDEGNESSICILCQDDTRTNVCTVMSAYVQLSSVLAKKRMTPGEATKCFGDITTPAGLHFSTCSHEMHYDCWHQYFATTSNLGDMRMNRLRRPLTLFAPLKNEFLCPLCSRLSNCVVPSIRHEEITVERNLSSCSADDITIQQWINLVENFVNPSVPPQQDVVIRINIDAITASSEEIPEVNKPSLQIGESVPPESQPAEEMEVNVDSLLEVFSFTIKTIKKSCSIDDTSDKERLILLGAATTFQATEVVLRFQKNSVFAPPSVRIKQVLSSMARSCFMASRYYKREQPIYEKRMKLLLGVSDDSVLNTNIFFTFVETLMSCECLRKSLKTSSVTNDKHILFLCSLAQLVQIILFIDVEQLKSELPNNSSSADSTLIQLFNQVRSHAGLSALTDISEEKLSECILTCFTPFVRCCALFLRYITNVSPPEALERSESLEQLCNYLGLPSNILAYFDVCGTVSLDPLVQRWCTRSDVVKTLASNYLTFPGLSEVNRLVALDNDYSDVLAKFSHFKCPRFHAEDDSVTPATCLICGETLCSQSYCCQQELPFLASNVGACTYHTYYCCFGSGIFLKGRDCTLILHSLDRGCYQPAPYLDQFGETDLGLRRGNPLKLDEERLKQVYLMWLNHSIPETIAHEIESNHTLANFDWIHL